MAPQTGVVRMEAKAIDCSGLRETFVAIILPSVSLKKGVALLRHVSDTASTDTAYCKRNGR
jgi:hypothetical protein